MHWVAHLLQAAPCLTGWRMCCRAQQSRSWWVYRDKKLLAAARSRVPYPACDCLSADDKHSSSY